MLLVSQTMCPSVESHPPVSELVGGCLDVPVPERSGLVTKNKRGFFRNTKQVLFGAFTWVGYYDQNDKQEKLKLPELQKGIFSPMNLRKNTKGLTGKKLNLLYAKNYSVETDISIVFRNIRNLGVEPS